MVFDFGTEAFIRDRFTPISIQFVNASLVPGGEKIWGVTIWFMGFGMSVIFNEWGNWKFLERGGNGNG